MITFVKPSGVEVQVNEYSAQFAQDLGWKLKTDDPEPEKAEETKQEEAPKRRGRPPKSEV